jgi:hypothetical protein
VVELSTNYLANWHIDLIAEYLEAVTAGESKRPLNQQAAQINEVDLRLGHLADVSPVADVSPGKRIRLLTSCTTRHLRGRARTDIRLDAKSTTTP